jgi:hypothetical protein
MAQNQDVNLNAAGLWTAPNDFSGVPPGAMDDATNVSIDNKNVLSSRRGFDAFGNPVSLTPGVVANRLTTFSTAEVDSVLTEYCVTRLSDGTLERSASAAETANDWYTWPGTFEDPASDAKLRFFETNRRKYVLTSSGPRLLDLETVANGGNVSTQAGVPKALDLIAVTQDIPGFLLPNVVATPTAKVTSSSPILTDVSDLTNIEVDMYASAPGAFADLVVHDITYTSIVDGPFGNSITIEYTNPGAPSQPLSVQVTGTDISVSLETNGGSALISTATDVLGAIQGSDAQSLVDAVVTGTGSNVQAIEAATPLAGGAAGPIPAGTKVDSIQDSLPLVTQIGNTTAGSTSISALASNAGIVAGVLVSGDGILAGSKVASISGTGPYTVVMNQAAYITATGASIAFASAPSVTLTNQATGSATPVVSFYRGSQVGYRLLFIGRDAINTALQYGSPTGLAIAVNTSANSVAVQVTTNLPDALTMGPSVTLYVQLYRSDFTEDATVPPLDQMQLVYEAPIEAGDITAGMISILDQTPDSLKGIPLYTGSDREGILQVNDPPPLCKDAAVYRDMVLYANYSTKPSLKLTLLGVTLPGGSGLQDGDEITLTPDVGSPVTLTAVSGTPSAPGEFQVITTGTPAQNITDTANNLISTINFAPGLLPGVSPVNAFLLSGAEDLPGQLLLVSKDYTGVTVDASLHGDTAWSPSIDTPGASLASENNPNAILIAKQAQGVAVPPANQILVGDASSPIIRVLALREYALVMKTDGVYRVTGLTPATLSAALFDNTTRIVGAETAAVLSNAVWMLSNQGVVSVSDTGVQIRSEPIKDITDRLVGPILETSRDVAFAVGHETQKKYILSAPLNQGDTLCSVQWVFNYVTNTWVDWSRSDVAMTVAQTSDHILIGNALSSTISIERNNGDERDFCEEDLFATIISVTGDQVLLDSTTGIGAGDVLEQGADKRATVIAVDPVNLIVTTEDDTGIAAGAVTIKTAIHCRVQWKPVVNGGNPALARQYSEGVLLFRNTQFNFGQIGFFTDVDNSIEYVPIDGSPSGAWGFFAWGSAPWGGDTRPLAIRFMVPEEKQYASMLIPILVIQNALSTWTCQGLSMSANRISQEVPSVDGS